MIIALYGAACTGKTTIARILRDILRWQLRSCGEEVRKSAEALGVPCSELPDAHHHAVDAETLLWAAANKPCLVEGRFLHYVLASQAQDVLLVRLEASDEDRLNRLTHRLRRPLALHDLKQEDEADLALCARIYTSDCAVPLLILNTSELSVDTCTERLKALVNLAGKPRD